jgi:hypothetical protein
MIVNQELSDASVARQAELARNEQLVTADAAGRRLNRTARKTDLPVA